MLGISVSPMHVRIKKISIAWVWGPTASTMRWARGNSVNHMTPTAPRADWWATVALLISGISVSSKLTTNYL